jgi:hypothetical protein
MVRLITMRALVTVARDYVIKLPSLSPDVHPTKVLFVSDKLPDGIILPPVAIAPSLNM